MFKTIANPTVLVVEDEPCLVRAYERAGRELGFSVSSCGSGRQAVELIKSDRPDAIILDLGLPGLDGRDVMRQLREMGLLGNIVVVIVSGRGAQHDRRLGLELGADDYAVKPVSPVALFNKVGWLVEKRRRRVA